jgi:hypothetical protein
VPTVPSCADGGCPVPDANCADAQTPTVTVGREGADGGRTCADGAGPSADGVSPVVRTRYNYLKFILWFGDKFLKEGIFINE